MTLKFTKDHEWVRLDGEVATVGITDYASDKLGDLVYLELPKLGRTLQAGDAAVVIESVKAASDVYAPIAGEVVAVNDALQNDLGTVTEDPQGRGWLFKLKIRDTAEIEGLMDEAAYRATL